MPGTGLNCQSSSGLSGERCTVSWPISFPCLMGQFYLYIRIYQYMFPKKVMQGEKGGRGAIGRRYGEMDVNLREFPAHPYNGRIFNPHSKGVTTW